MTDTSSKEQLAEESRMVVDALRTTGSNVNSVYDLVNTRSPYPEAIPVLLEYLPRVEHPRMKEGIARALGVKEARSKAAEPLLREFKRYTATSKSEEHAKWAIANAVSAVADDSNFAEISHVLLDEKHGGARSGMVAALSNMKQHREEAVELLLDLIDDVELANQAMITLGNLRDPRARPAIEPFLKHEDSWVRKQAERALAKIDKAQKRTAKT